MKQGYTRPVKWINVTAIYFHVSHFPPKLITFCGAMGGCHRTRAVFVFHSSFVPSLPFPIILYTVGPAKDNDLKFILLCNMSTYNTKTAQDRLEKLFREKVINFLMFINILPIRVLFVM